MIFSACLLAYVLVQSVAATPNAREAFASVIAQNHVSINDAPAGQGSAKLTIMAGENNVQASNYDWRSSQIENTGDKRIAAVYMDLATAVFSDVVIDSDGTGGDHVAKSLSHDWGTTETNPVSTDQYQWAWPPVRSDPAYTPNAPFDPADLANVNNLFVNELSDSGLGCDGGFRGQLMLFGDFSSGETYEFSGDMDPNSLAGLNQGTASTHAEWDVGGVSGAELINSVVTVLFGDGSTASGTISSDGSQAGAVAVISENLAAAPGLTVDGIAAGGTGSITGPPPVIVSARAGTTVRVTMISAFDPVDNQEPLAGGLITAEALVAARLLTQYPEFPVNNARLLQHVEVTIPAGANSVDVSSSFQFTDDVAVAFTAVSINSAGVPLSTTSAPIRLLYTGIGFSCPDGLKPDGSGFCVQQSCNANFICPANSIRKENRKCYDTFNDCDCIAGFTKSGSQCVAASACPDGRKLDPSGYCVRTWCNADYQCPSGTERRPNRNCYDSRNDCQNA